MLRHFMLRHVMLRHVMLRHGMLRHVMIYKQILATSETVPCTFSIKQYYLSRASKISNKAGYMATQVACRWAGAAIKVT